MKEPDENFDSLTALLALKRHEVPPPGYFNDFSAEVVARIRRGESGNPDGLASKLMAEAPWLYKLLTSFQERPALAGVFASALCLLLVAGIVYTDNPGATHDDLMPPETAENSSPVASMASVAASPAPDFMGASVMPASFDSNTNPIQSLEPSGASFGSQNPLFKPVGYPQ